MIHDRPAGPALADARRVRALIVEARRNGHRWSESSRAAWRRRLDRACAGKHEDFERALRAVTGGRRAAW